MSAVAAPRAPGGDTGSVDTRVRRSRRGIPAAGRWIALIACLNAVAWSLIVPPFHVPDEMAHFYYAQYLAETGELPVQTPENLWFSKDINNVLDADAHWAVIGRSDTPVPALRADTAALHRAQRPGVDRVGTGDAASASNNPPVYYLVQDVAYAAARGADVTGRLAVMRLLSALLAGLTTLCVYLFLREVLPRSPLSWTVGGLAAGLQPTFAFIASGVNNDGGLYLVSAALLLALARLFRRGLTLRRAAAVGALLGLGVLVKTQVAAFAPAVGLALLLCAWRQRGDRGATLRALAGGLAAGIAPLAVYGVLGATIWDRPVVDRVSGVVASRSIDIRPWQWSEQLSYLWQLYLPRAPNLHDLLPGVPPYTLWFKGMVGRFGWLDYQLPSLVYPLAGVIFVAVAVLALLAVWKGREALRARVGEALVYGVFAAGLAAAIAVAGYRALLDNVLGFEQARYLLPLLGLYALFPALAVRAGGPRWGRVIAILLVTGVIGHSLLAQLTTLWRYYG
jgi:4-amino-4-deoxy-L-arabinose transferase-like glycosyltransferase